MKMRLLAWVMMAMAAGMVSCRADEKAGKAAESGAGELTWLQSFDEARRQAAASGRPILADFSGSDWCGWCIRLEKEVFSQAVFRDYARQNLVLLLVDFPRFSSQSADLARNNRDLAERFRIQGFPTVLLLDADGREIARTGYQPGGPAAYVEHLKSLLRPK